MAVAQIYLQLMLRRCLIILSCQITSCLLGKKTTFAEDVCFIVEDKERVLIDLYIYIYI